MLFISRKLGQFRDNFRPLVGWANINLLISNVAIQNACFVCLSSAARIHTFISWSLTSDAFITVVLEHIGFQSSS
jgi:hypothetical protein